MKHNKQFHSTGRIVVPQSISNGTRVIFDPEDLDMETEEAKRDFPKKGEKNFIIDSLETFTELGDKDFEYYNIVHQSDPSIKYYGISGYHLTPVEDGFNAQPWEKDYPNAEPDLEEDQEDWADIG